MSAIDAKDVQDLRKTRAALLDRKGWLLLEKLAAWCKGNPPRCESSVSRIREYGLGWSPTTIVARLKQLEQLKLIQRKRRYQETTIFTLTLSRLDERPNEIPVLEFQSPSEIPDEIPLSAKNHTKVPRARARRGTAEAQCAEASAVPVGSARARTPPATQHTPQPPRRVEDARPRKPASLRSGDGALAGARRATPAPARAQSFDIEAWTPTPEQLERVRAVRPDLDLDMIDEQLASFRDKARSNGWRIRDGAECLLRFRGFVRQTFPPRRVATPKGSAGAERAAPAKPAGKNKRASAQLNGARPIPEALNLLRTCLHQALDAQGRTMPGEPDVKAVAVEAVRPFYLRSGLNNRAFNNQLKFALRIGVVRSADIDGTSMLWEPGQADRLVRGAAASSQRAANGKRKRKSKSKAERDQLEQEFQQLEKLAQTANCRIYQSSGRPAGRVVVYYPHETLKGRDDLKGFRSHAAAASWLQDRLKEMRRSPQASAVRR